MDNSDKGFEAFYDRQLYDEIKCMKLVFTSKESAYWKTVVSKSFFEVIPVKYRNRVTNDENFQTWWKGDHIFKNFKNHYRQTNRLRAVDCDDILNIPDYKSKGQMCIYVLIKLCGQIKEIFSAIRM